MFPYAEMLSTIQTAYPSFAAIPTQRPNDTARTYRVPGYAGKIGFITSMTENFCGSCNRLRITGDGNIKACLFGNEEFSLRDLMRRYREADAPVGEGKGWEDEARKVVGLAVSRKEEGHKTPEVLVGETRRPMVAIGG